jgi:ATP-dependent helicase HrpA
MNFRVVDEHGRQLGTGRNLGALKAELGAQARGAFQALAAVKGVPSAPSATLAGSGSSSPSPAAGGASSPSPSGGGQGGGRRAAPGPHPSLPPEGEGAKSPERSTAWTFGELPELMEIRKGGTRLIGFPALIDLGDAVTIEVFDEPEVAAAKHRAGLRRLFALQIKDALKYLERNIPDLQKMAVAFMPLGTQEELRDQIIEVALERAFLLDPLPATESDFKRRVDEGRGRLTLIANEIARLAGTILVEYAAAARKIKDTKGQPEATADATQQLQRLVPKRFLAATPWAQLQHFPRYLKAITLRLDKLRADPARDAARLAELKPQEQRYWRLLAERKGAADARLQEYRWLLEELRVSFFAQELRTPQPVSIKRLEKLWGQLNS